MDVEWGIGSTHEWEMGDGRWEVGDDLGSILHPTQMAFSETLISLLSDNKLKSEFMIL
jgi:hypothetical protein